MVWRMIVAVGLWLLALPAVAQDDPCLGRAADIVARAYPEAEMVQPGEYMLGGRWIRLPQHQGPTGFNMVCRQWPAYPGHLLVAVPLLEVNEPDIQSGDLDLLVMAVDTLDVQALLTLPEFLVSDAMAISDLAFDTAYYDVFGDGPAFGVRISYAGSSRPNPFQRQVLSLFYNGPDGLRPIMDKLIVRQSGGEWDMDCTGAFYEFSRVIDLSETRHNGAADLILRPSGRNYVDEVVGGDCVSRDVAPEEPLQVITLEYDGQTYPLPEGLQGW